MTLNGNPVTPTSSFPYHEIGPVQFSNLNFVRTEQVDYYYGPYASGSAAVLLSEVKQIYDPTLTVAIIVVMILGFFWLLGYGIKKVSKY